ncbi:low temperature requirement protein A [Micromonospora sp. CPCC 205711]|uniref:low temperature requirement protein A n=1 Tax=Micromonospora sp. CPCC 205547 TaxID=3122400 RepID=UPI002FF0C820
MSDVRPKLDGAERRRLDEEEAEQIEPVRPPDINRTPNRSATRLELFFDLAFVIFVERCTDLLAADETWTGGLQFAAVVSIGWWAWASTTLYANRFDTDDAVFRLLTLTAMAGVVGMAASVDGIDEQTGRWFALAYALVRLVLIVGYLRAWWHVADSRSTIRPYLLSHGLGAVIWLASVAVAAPGRYVLWGIGVLVDQLGPLAVSRLRDTAPLHMEHLPERFALFIILVLGESVAAAVTGVHDGGWRPSVVLTAALAFVVVAGLWWSYFDLSGGAAKRRLVEEGGETTPRGVHDVYVYLHLPMAIALAAVAVGLDHAIVHAEDDHLSAGTRGVLAVGLAGYLLSAAVMQAALSRRVRAAVIWPGLGVPTVAAVVLLDLPPVTTFVLLTVIVAVGVVTGFALHRAGEVRTAKV